jgi:RNA polymerase sigma-70 factor (ECF subfamily)
MALRLVKDDDEAQEVTQLAFIQAYRKMDTWRGENFGAWVSIIANHIALRLLEKEKRRQTETLDENTDLPTEDYDEQKEERIRSLETAVAQLPEQDRHIIEEHYYGNVPLAELARRLGQTENNIKVRLFRIRERLKEKLKSEN